MATTPPVESSPSGDVKNAPLIPPSAANDEVETQAAAVETLTDATEAPTLKRKRQHREDEKEEEDGNTISTANDNDDSKQQQRAQHPMWKTSLCSYFRRTGGSCSHGSACRYAHGEAELRPRPDNTWDPTSLRAKNSNNINDDNSKKKPLPDHFHLPSEMEFDDSLVPAQDENACPEGSEAGSLPLDKCMIGIPIKWTSEKLRAFLDEQGVACKTVKKKKGMTVGFLEFEDESQLAGALQRLSGKFIGGKEIKVADVIRKSNVKKAKTNVPLDGGGLDSADNGDAVDDGGGVFDGRAEDSVPRARSARDMVVPLAGMPYEEQLEYKKNSLVQILKRLTRNARKACPGSVPLPEWIHKSREIGGLPCMLEGILPSPSISGYRNKCEFTVGFSLHGKKTVGFALGNFREGMIAVEEPSDCPNISKIACTYAMMFQEFLQSSALPVWNRLNNTGFWRQLTVREGRQQNNGAIIDGGKEPTVEVMLIIQVCSSDVDAELMESEFKQMAKSFALGASSCDPQLPLTALVVQDHRGICNAAPADCPSFSLPVPDLEEEKSPKPIAEARIHDFLCNLKFCISPTAFFQVNTLAAEKLYSLAGDWAKLTPNTLLFDICCGTGTIGLTLAHRVGLVVGIEVNPSSVLDAQRNADINCITNCRFICSKAEDVMGTLLKEYLNGGEEHPNGMDKKNFNSNNDDVDSPVHASSDSLDADVTVTDIHTADHAGDSDSLLKSCTTEHKERDEGISFKEEEGILISLKQFEDVVVIVDPPRAGLHPVVIKALRTHPRLRRLVYISCNPETLVANAIELCTPTTEEREKSKGNRGWRKMSSAGLARQRAKSMPHSEPFRPVRAMAVDMFPHTPHCEMVMLFER